MIADGGSSIWARYHKSITLPDLSARLKKKGIILSGGLIHDITSGMKLNSTRMGSGWMNMKEAEKAIDIMYKIIH